MLPEMRNYTYFEHIIAVVPEMRNYTYFEHIIAVAVVGLLFGLAYPRSSIFGVVRAAFLENLQTLILDRQPTVRCFGKMAGGVAGIFLARIYTPGAGRYRRSFQDLR